METDREIDEIAARCVSTLVYYHNCGGTARDREVLEADAAAIAEWLGASGLPAEAIGELILGPVLAELRARYDRAHATALHEEFVAALYPRRPSPAHPRRETDRPGPLRVGTAS